ncbi:hypothetical protein CRG98_008656 [Punica granatum]|uniref:Uncharacterized protein n=1 Tax=Punica granatum TaxID=22663 RepID=A0A2I0KRL6_PUNGR|nr:hypothetical protein CRG98_008656 [Punica granatum]
MAFKLLGQQLNNRSADCGWQRAAPGSLGDAQGAAQDQRRGSIVYMEERAAAQQQQVKGGRKVRMAAAVEWMRWKAEKETIKVKQGGCDRKVKEDPEAQRSREKRRARDRG